MAKDIAALNQNIADYRDLIGLYQGALATAQTQKAVAVQAAADAQAATEAAVAAMNLTKAQKDELQALFDAQTTAVAAAVDETDAVENVARAGLPGVPPIDTPTDPGVPPVDPDPTTPTDPAVVNIEPVALPT
jgi:predicted component of type VI protein secretion system